MTQTKQITQQQLHELFDYNPDTGLFIRKVNHGKGRQGAVVGYFGNRGYVRIGVYGKTYLAHRLAWIFVYGELDSNLEIDHIDGNRTNNCINNLRAVSTVINRQNLRKPLKNNATGFLGISKTKYGWKAQIQANGVLMYCGTYPTRELAHQAYLSAKRIHHEGCTL